MTDHDLDDLAREAASDAHSALVHSRDENPLDDMAAAIRPLLASLVEEREADARLLRWIEMECVGEHDLVEKELVERGERPNELLVTVAKVVATRDIFAARVRSRDAEIDHLADALRDAIAQRDRLLRAVGQLLLSERLDDALALGGHPGLASELGLADDDIAAALDAGEEGA